MKLTCEPKNLSLSVIIFVLMMITYMHDYAGMFCTSMLMRTFHWDLGLLDLTWSILMIGDYVVARHLVKILNASKYFRIMLVLG